MIKESFIIFTLMVASSHFVQAKPPKSIDMGDYWLICSQDPIDFGIVLDSSASINVGSGLNFKKGLEFLQHVMEYFDIGQGREQVRVSIIPFAKRIYTEQAFELNKYATKKEVIDAIGNLEYKSGLATYTNLGLDYLRTNLLTPSKTRSWAKKIGLVLTDGDSNNKYLTEASAKKAREAGIEMFAIGVGRVKMQELLNIAGDPSRVIKVESYDDLKDQVDVLTGKTCKRKEKPTTTTPAPASCGEEHPSDINFVFSPSELGVDGTQFATSFIRDVVDYEEFATGLQYGTVTGLCPRDRGFNLDEYQHLGPLKKRLREFGLPKMSNLVKRTTDFSFSERAGGRSDAQKVAVLFVDDYNSEGLEQEMADLVSKGVRVFLVDATGHELSVGYPDVTVVPGPNPTIAASNFIHILCNTV